MDRVSSSVWSVRRLPYVVLQERVAFPVVREEDAPKVGMAVEDDPEHVVAFALHPVGAAIERGQGGTAHLAGAEPGAHRDHERRVEVFHAAEHLEALVLPVDRGQPVEVAAAQLVVSEASKFLPAFARQGDGEPTVGDRVHSEPLLDARARVGGRHAPPGSDAAVRFPVFWNSSTWAWSLSNPYISESGVGGQPGPDTIIRSECRGEAHGTMPKRSTSKRDANVAIISIAQHARPNVTGQIDDFLAQLKILSVDVVTIQPPGM